MKFLGRTALLLLTGARGAHRRLCRACRCQSSAPGLRLAGCRWRQRAGQRRVPVDDENLWPVPRHGLHRKPCLHADLGLSPSAASAESWDSSPGLFRTLGSLSYRYLSRSGDERLDLSTPEWLMQLGSERVVGGGPAVRSRAGTPLVELPPDGASPESALLADSGAITPWGLGRVGCHGDELLSAIWNSQRQRPRPGAAPGQFGRANTATLSA